MSEKIEEVTTKQENCSQPTVEKIEEQIQTPVKQEESLQNPPPVEEPKTPIQQECPQSPPIVEDECFQTSSENDIELVEENSNIPMVRSQILCVKEEQPTSKIIEEENFIEDNMTLVSVKGNPKVMRCTECNSFVSKNKPHSKAKCREIAAKFKASRGKTKRPSSKRRNRSIERKLKKIIDQKRFKKLPKTLRDAFKKIIE